MKIFNNGKLKILAAATLTIFTLAVTFSSTFAWFTSLRMSQHGNEDMIITNLNKRLKSFKLYNCIPPKDDLGNPLPIPVDATSYTFEKQESLSITYDYNNNAPIISGDTNVFMNRYSMLDQIHPILGIFEIDPLYSNISSETPLNITASTTEEFVAAFDNNGDFINELDYENNPLSSIIKFDVFTFSSLSNISNIDNLEIRKTLLQTGETFSFVSISADMESFTYQKKLTLFSASSGVVNFVGVVFDYYPEALEYIYSAYLGSEIIEGQFGDSGLTYTCDFRIKL